MELARYFNKNLGETPLECLNRFKTENPEYAGLTATYAGRLDPAAEGEILFLFGDLLHKKDEYLSHSKIYTATFVLGVSTDTGDLLGLPLKSSAIVPTIDEEKIKKLVSEIKNLKQQTYPAYSSKPVDGKPLFVHAREGNDVERPIRDVEIFSVKTKEVTQIKREEILERIGKVCSLVMGDFRQADIVAGWYVIADSLGAELPAITLTLHVSSGTYIRGLTDQIEKICGSPAVLCSLIRTKIQR
jgi:tRNA pseudouridine(55) synthase